MSASDGALRACVGDLRLRDCAERRFREPRRARDALRRGADEARAPRGRPRRAPPLGLARARRSGASSRGCPPPKRSPPCRLRRGRAARRACRRRELHHPVRGLVIGLLVMAVLGLGLGLLPLSSPMPRRPRRARAQGLAAEPRSRAPGLGAHLHRGVHPRLPRRRTLIGHGHRLAHRARPIQPHTRRRGRQVALQLPSGNGDLSVPRRDPPVSAGGVETYVTVFEGPNRFIEGQHVVAPTVNASVSNPFVVRFRSRARPRGPRSFADAPRRPASTPPRRTASPPPSRGSPPSHIITAASC